MKETVTGGNIETALKQEIDKVIQIVVDVRYNPEYKQDEIEMYFLDGDGNYTQCFMLVETSHHTGDLGKKYRWTKKTK